MKENIKTVLYFETILLISLKYLNLYSYLQEAFDTLNGP